jgi:predicted nucleic acid-binding protein
MTVVVDASAAIEITLGRELAGAFQRVLNEAEVVLAPDIFPAEITNVFWKYGHHSDLATEVCQRGIAYCLDLVDDYVSTQYLCREVFSESIKLKHAAYDVFYLVVARRNDAVVLTRNKKMIEAARALKVSVVGGRK